MSSMMTATSLTEELGTCERNITAIRLKAVEKLDAEKERMRLIAKKREEVIAEHAARVAEFVEEKEVQLEFTKENARDKIKEAKDERAAADKTAVRALGDADAADQWARDLERQVKALNKCLDDKNAEYAEREKKAMVFTDEMVQEQTADANRRVLFTSLEAAEIQETSVDALEAITKEMRVQSSQCEKGSRERSRYTHLENVVLKRGEGTSEMDSSKARTKVMQDWHSDWIDSAVALHRHPNVVVESVQKQRNYANRSRVNDTPSRSVDRARYRATEVQAMRAKLPLSHRGLSVGSSRPLGVPYRPVTAP